MSHPSSHSFGGASTNHIILNTLDLINGLYEDPELRKQRMAITGHIFETLNGFKNGMKVVAKGKNEWSYRALPGFINNKSNPNEIHFYYNPCYEVTDTYFENNQWVHPPAIYFKANSIEIKPGQLVLKDDNGGYLTITEITDSNEQGRFNDWFKKYEKYCQAAGNFLFTPAEIIDSFTSHLREFHKM